MEVRSSREKENKASYLTFSLEFLFDINILTIWDTTCECVVDTQNSKQALPQVPILGYYYYPRMDIHRVVSCVRLG